jgi:hypothetical protein
MCVLTCNLASTEKNVKNFKVKSVPTISPSPLKEPLTNFVRLFEIHPVYMMFMTIIKMMMLK